jgi:Family of unknown function (DUF6069)
MPSRTDTARDPQAATRRRVRAFAVTGAVVAAVAVWAVGDPLLGNDLVVEQPGRAPQDLGAGAVAFVTLVSSLLGWGLLAILERLTSRARLIWAAAALVVLVASFGPLIGVEASGGSKAVLAILHVVVGAIIIPVFWRTAATGGGASGDRRHPVETTPAAR